MASDAEVLENCMLESSHLTNGDTKMEVDVEEDDYTDPKSIQPPGNLKELIQQLHKVFARDEINIDYVKALMESYKSNPREWKKFAKFDTHRYTRNLVDEGNGKFNLMVLCWNEAQASSIHSHAGSHCFLKVLSGNVREEMYGWPERYVTSHQQTGTTEVAKADEGEMVPKEELTFDSDRCTYICDDLGLHRVENPSHVDKAVTLHLYSPPFDECLCFDQRTGRPVKAAVTFWSKFGKRTPFGRDPKPVQQENN
ncbi:cysteine dioxygenase type 1-like [Babylonia areolata]|uniref:cysteine dioxygenase type 1-like n=1 Tax=Babylonia areolata TaxID=304850 RepID=UPI003FD36909